MTAMLKSFQGVVLCDTYIKNLFPATVRYSYLAKMETSKVYLGIADFAFNHWMCEWIEDLYFSGDFTLGLICGFFNTSLITRHLTTTLYLNSPAREVYVSWCDHYNITFRFKLRPGIEFHLYISTAPCGDSAIFAPSDINTDQQDQAGGDGKHHPIFENKKQGVLRTKVENGRLMR